MPEVYFLYMEELQISGRRFISSRRVAKENGYHTDYIGQLIRGGKVKGQKVGRAWYVDAESFAAYLGKEAPLAEPSEKPIAEEPIVEEVSTPAVEAEPAEVEVKLESTPVLVLQEESIEPLKVEEPVIVEESTTEVEVKKVEEVETQEEPLVEETSKEIEEAGMAVPEPAPIPVRIATSSQTKGLRYYRDTDPLLPEIQNQQSSSKVSPSVANSVGAPQEEAVIIRPIQKINTRSRGALGAPQALALTALALAMLVASTVVSSGLSLNTSVSGGNAANTWYSFELPHSGSF